MKITPDHINEIGLLVGFNVHDARMIGLSYRDDAPFCLELLRLDGSVLQLSLVRVARFGFRGFRNGAIVSNVFAWRPQQTPSWQSSDPEGAWAVLFGNDIDVAALPAVIKPLLDASESSYLVSVECSYGGSIAVLCGDIEVETR